MFLANAYVDLGTWWCITPFIGAGIGTTRNTISSFVDIGATQPGATILSTTYGDNASKWNLAWAAYAGLAYKVTPGLKLELTYRYVNLGKATTGLTNSFDGITVVNAHPFNFGTITSQDVMLGFRWNLGEPEPPEWRRRWFPRADRTRETSVRKRGAGEIPRRFFLGAWRASRQVRRFAPNFEWLRSRWSRP